MAKTVVRENESLTKLRRFKRQVSRTGIPFAEAVRRESSLRKQFKKKIKLGSKRLVAKEMGYCLLFCSLVIKL